MTPQAQEAGIDFEEARRIFEPLLASKLHCSPALNAAGRDLLKALDALLATHEGEKA